MTSGPLQSISTPLQHRVVLNVARLPTYGHGTRSSQWWGIMGFCAAEGIGFVLAFGAYFYLVFINGVLAALVEAAGHLHLDPSTRS
jgi:hypothetical protein